MTAQAQETAQPRYHDVPADPQVIRGYLLPEDLPVFEEAFRNACAKAGEVLDLAPLADMLERWRRMAIRSQDPEHLRQVREETRRLIAAKAPAGE